MYLFQPCIWQGALPPSLLRLLSLRIKLRRVDSKQFDGLLLHADTVLDALGTTLLLEATRLSNQVNSHYLPCWIGYFEMSKARYFLAGASFGKLQ